MLARSYPVLSFTLAMASLCAVSTPARASNSKTSAIHTELHATLCDGTDLSATLKKLGLKESDTDQDRDMYFFDTRALDLYRQDLVVRLRIKAEGGSATLNVKIREMDFSDVGSEWFADSDFKCEHDRYGTRRSDNCSQNSKLSGDEARALVRGSLSLEKALSKTQRRFLEKFGDSHISLGGPISLGPIPSRVWKIKGVDGFEDDLSLEHWNLPGEHAILELSTRASGVTAARTRADLPEYLRARGVSLCDRQESKAKETLEYLAGH